MAPAQTLTVPVAGAPHTLEARLARPAQSQSTLAVIAPPHPVYGGTIGNPVVRTLEQAFARRGMATLAFNFRGTGESTGEPSGEPSDALADYLAAARAVPDLVPTIVSGYSFGGIAALAAGSALAAEQVVMVAPPLGMLDPAQLGRLRGALLVVLGDDDEYAPIEAARTLFEARANTQLVVLPEVEHFFLGSAVPRLAAALEPALEALSLAVPR